MGVQVEGLMRLMDGEHVGPFNIGNPGEFTMLELAEVGYSDARVYHSTVRWSTVQYSTVLDSRAQHNSVEILYSRVEER